MAFSYESNEVFSLFWRATWQSAVLALMVATTIYMSRNWLAAKWRVLLWMLPLCRMLVLVVPASGMSIFNGVSWLTESQSVLPMASSREKEWPPHRERNTTPSIADLSVNENPDSFERGDAFEKPVVAGPVSRANKQAKLRVSVATIAITIWLLGCVVLAIRWGWAAWALRRTLARCEPLDSDIWEQLKPASLASSRLQTLLPVRCVTTLQDLGPATCGFFRPTILLPRQLVSDLTTDQLRAIILHEYQHIRRFDVLLLTLSRCVKIVHWFNPVAYLVSRILRQEMELAVDAATIQSLRISERQAYGYLLLQLARRPASQFGLAQMADRSSDMKARINAISNPFQTSPARTVFAIGLICTLLTVGFTQEKGANSISETNTASTMARVSEARANSITAAMESQLKHLPKLYESASRSIVRIESPDNQNMTGVIVSSDGHILSSGSFSFFNDEGPNILQVHLSDGRTATATVAGSSSEWRIAVIKIREEGPWPAIELGSTKEMKAGEPCLVMGYSHRGDTKFDSSPSVNYGFVTRNEPTHWFTITCFPGFFDDSVVVGMDGSLLGIHDFFSGDQSYVTAVNAFTSNRDDLFTGKNLDWVRYPPHPGSDFHIDSGGHPEMLGMRMTDDVLGPGKPPASMDVAQLSKVKEIATKTTVRLISKDRLAFDGVHYDRWSGVIVSEDGYILTCSHTSQSPGERVTVCLSDGRDADAVVLGTNPISDVGLVKITSPGNWPFAEIADSSTLKRGDPLVAVGYPAIDGPTQQFLTERTPVISSTAVRLQSVLHWNPELYTENFQGNGGMSGGGIFNQQGQYVAILQSLSSGVRSELAKKQWDDLRQIDSIDTLIGITHPLQKRFVDPSKSVAPSVVELLVEAQPVCFGIVVGADGWILAKRSALGDNVSCRLPDQSVVVTERWAESQEYDLALLKIGVAGLTAAAFSEMEPPSKTESLCAVGSRQILKPGIVSIETRAIPPEPAWKGDSTEDTQDGVKIVRIDGGWRNKINLSTEGTKIKRDDVIVSINGHETSNIAALTQVLESKLNGYCTGDLVSVALRRKGELMNVLTPLPRASVADYWAVDEYDTPRRSGFDAVFDTDIELLLHEVGCPLIDVEGQIRGVAIASRGRNETQRGPTSALPSRVVKQVIEQLMAEAKSR